MPRVAAQTDALKKTERGKVEKAPACRVVRELSEKAVNAWKSTTLKELAFFTD